MTRKMLYIGLLAGFIGYHTNAQSLLDGQVAVNDLQIEKQENRLRMNMRIDLSKLKLKGNREVVLKPVLRAEYDSLAFPALTIAGRTRYYLHLRNDRPVETDRLFRCGEVTEIPYTAEVTYEQWMEQAALVLEEGLCGCQCEVLMDNDELLTTLDFAPKVFRPTFVYRAPTAEAEKVREVSGSAFIDFPVNRTEIHESYRGNVEELQKIRQTIDLVRNDPDTRITSIHIKGYASPEGSYSNNTRLAQGRTEALRDYVRHLYDFPREIFTTDYEPEDWDGLRKHIEDSHLPNRQELLALINSEEDPDRKDGKIRSLYPELYRQLLQTVYPALRHSDYSVAYVVRAYTDVEEAKRILQVQPAKLSLQEFYLIANSYEPGSDAYNETFKTMVRIYPDDATANLNAMNVAMAAKDWETARQYATKAGDNAEATYARGVLAGLTGDYDTARSYLGQADRQGIPEAKDALEQINKMSKH